MATASANEAYLVAVPNAANPSCAVTALTVTHPSCKILHAVEATVRRYFVILGFVEMRADAVS